MFLNERSCRVGFHRQSGAPIRLLHPDPGLHRAVVQRRDACRFLLTTARQYLWSGTNPSWASGATVAVKLDIGLINICARSPAVAHAIKEATPSFDFCHMTSVLDLANLTELDLPGGRGTGLKAGDFEGLSGLTRLDLSHYILSLQQLPVGVFDGLDSLESPGPQPHRPAQTGPGRLRGPGQPGGAGPQRHQPAAEHRARGRLRPTCPTWRSCASPMKAR